MEVNSQSFSATPRRVAIVTAARRRVRAGTSMVWSSGNVKVEDWWSWRVEAKLGFVPPAWFSRNWKGRYDPEGEFGGRLRKLSRSFSKGGEFVLSDDPDVKAGGRRSSIFGDDRRVESIPCSSFGRKGNGSS